MTLVRYSCRYDTILLTLKYTQYTVFIKLVLGYIYLIKLFKFSLT